MNLMFRVVFSLMIGLSIVGTVTSAILALGGVIGLSMVSWFDGYNSAIEAMQKAKVKSE